MMIEAHHAQGGRDLQPLKLSGSVDTIEGASRVRAGDARPMGGGPSTIPASRGTDNSVGLTSGTTMDRRRESMRPPDSSHSFDAGSEFTEGDRTWRIVRGYEWLRTDDAFDWQNLRPATDSVLFKRNSQRDVWRVRHPAGDFFVKQYHPSGPVARFKQTVRGPIAVQEWSVGLYAAAHRIATVEPAAVAWDTRRRSGPSLLITRAVLDVKPLSEYWPNVRPDQTRANALTDALAKLIARAHQCGFRHGDMHPGNILVRCSESDCQAFFVDLHRVHVGRSVSPASAVANLAQLNQWFRRNATRTQRLRFLRAYINYRDQFAQASRYARNWQIDIRRLVADLAAQADRHANRLWAKRDRRTMRSNRYFRRIAPAPGWRGHVLLQSKHPSPTRGHRHWSFTQQQWESWLARPLDWVDPQRQSLLKDSHTATVCLARLGDGPAAIRVVAKRTLARHAGKRLGRMFGPSRNLRAWRMANKLRNRDLPAAQPLAVVERFAAGVVRVDSVSLTEYIEDACDLEVFLTREVAALEPSEQRRVKDRLIESVVHLLKAFHERGFIHRDMKAPNLLVRWRPPFERTPTLVFIDMDGISHRRFAGDRQRLRAVVRLCASLLSSPGCTASDRLRFLQRYLLGPGKTSAGWKEHWRRIHNEVCSKLQDKEIRRRWKLAHYGRE